MKKLDDVYPKSVIRGLKERQPSHMHLTVIQTETNMKTASYLLATEGKGELIDVKRKFLLHRRRRYRRVGFACADKAKSLRMNHGFMCAFPFLKRLT